MNEVLAPRRADKEAALARLAGTLGDRFSVNSAMREQHGKGEAYHDAVPPDAVCFATSTEEVAFIVRTCADAKLPVIAFGAGTSLEGHVAALHGGVCIDLTRLDKVLEVNDEDLDALVQTGVTRKRLNSELRDSGLFFPIDPGADATLGGMASTRASGTNAVRYGTMRDSVLGLTVVTSDGRVIKTGGRSRKSAAGYDLTRLLIGSEGTLGIITELRLRLHGLPEAISSATCAFPSVDAAVQTVIDTMQMGVPVARIELLDELQMRACIDFARLEGMREAPTLFFEFHGTDAGVEEQVAIVADLARGYGGSAFQFAREAEDRNRLWQARHDAYYAAIALKPGCKGWATDVCVPMSRLAQCIAETQRDLDEAGLLAPIVGHVGDGNFHLLMLFDPDDAEQRRKANVLNKQLVRRALDMGGTCTGEHGIGMGKMDSLLSEHGDDAVEVMRRVKMALDPDNIMNPGKIFRLA